MMDPLSIAAGIIGILQATKSCLKFSRKFAGPSQFGTSELNGMKNSLYEFHGIMKTFQTHLDIYEDDEDHLQALAHLMPAMIQCQTAIQLIKEHLQNSSFVEKALKGAKFDKKLKLLLKTIEESGKLFKIAILSDQQSIILGVKKYMQDMRQDIQSVRSEQEDTRAATIYSNIRAWLGAQSDNDINSQRHKDNLSNRHPGSGQWLVEHPSFIDWSTDSRSQTYNTLWLKGPPGAGKSYACSAAIEHVARQQELYLYYFCRFDDASASSGSGYDATSAVKTAAILVDQLFRYFWRDNRHIADAVARSIQLADKNMSTLQKVSRIILSEATKASQNESGARIVPIKLYLLFDGLDEDKHLAGAQEVISLFHGLENEVPVIVRLWISSRNQLRIRHRLKNFSILNLDDFAERDVQTYLADSVSKLKDFDSESANIDGMQLKDWVLRKLQRRAKGNFLYAKLTLERLRQGVFNIEDITALITSSVPDNFTDIYQRIMGQYQKDQYRYVSLLFSIVTFARRPLHVKEIQEAMTLALSEPSKGLDPRRAPLSLERLFPPLIETQQNPQDSENPLCHLCHATVHEFLVSNSEILGSGFEIAPAIFGRICLRYLSLPRYSSLMTDPKTGTPGFTEGSLSSGGYGDTREHALLAYCARFWYKHLEDMDDTSGQFGATCEFLESSNFQTLLQIQSVTVARQFAPFYVSPGPLMINTQIVRRQALPWWVDEERLTEDRNHRRYRMDYRHFVNEWGYLLDAGICPAPDPSKCSGKHFPGQVDRCLSGLLGPESFMRKMLERYPSFMLTESGVDYARQGARSLSEGLSLTQDYFTLVSSDPSDKSMIKIEAWKLRDVAIPKVASTTTIVAPGVADPSLETTQRISLSQGTTFLRLQNWLIATEESCEFLRIPGAGVNGKSFSPHTEDFERKGNIVVITSRRKRHELPLDSKNSDLEKIPDAGVSTSKHSRSDSGDGSSDETDGDDEDGESMLSSSSSDYNSAEETCSEGSTEVHTDEDDYSVVSSDSASEASDSSGDSGNDEGSDFEQESLDDCTGDRMRDISLTQQQPADNDVDLEGGPLKQGRSRPQFSGSGRHIKARKDQIRASISVFRVGGTTPTRIFHYEQEIPYLLYHSGPIIHPSKPMVIWPLAGGQVLFADYAAKTFFIRGSMASTRDSRHISMKCRFSECGEFLHVASLEGRIVSQDRSQGENTPTVDKEETEPPKGDSSVKGNIVLSLFVTTHRLSGRKTTRSPPRLLHKVRIMMGKFAGLSLEKLPFTFTWAPRFLYFTTSGCRLNVFRVHLFAGRAGEPMVALPQLPVMLPFSAAGRQVHYSPPKGNDKRALVLMGSYPGDSGVRIQLKALSVEAANHGIGDLFARRTMNYPCPPVGFYLHEEQDFGGWGASEAEKPVERGEKYRDGRLVWKTENFAFEDGVDLEGICQVCKGPMYFSTS